MKNSDRKAIRVGGAIVLAAVLVLRVLPATGKWITTQRLRLRQERELLEETEHLIRESPQVEDSMVVLTRKVADLAPSLLHGESGPEAVADLGMRLSLAAERERLTVGKVTTLADSMSRADGTLRRVTVLATFTGDVSELLHLMDSLAGGEPTLTPVAFRVVAAEPGAPVAAPEALAMELTVTGWFLVKGVTP